MESRVSATAVASLLWVIWLLSWMIAAAWSERTVKSAGSIRQAPNNIIAIIGVVLLFGFNGRHILVLRQIPRGAAWSMVALVTVGLSVSWWARIHLGRLWSRWVARKADHHIVQSGPYAFVRHPIYTGLILATFATSMLFETVFAYVGAALMIVSFYMKARLEERFLREELGATAYDDYARRVPMLVPLQRTRKTG